MDKFETFLQTHDLVASVPAFLRPDGPLSNLIPRSFQPDDVTVPLAATGRILYTTIIHKKLTYLYLFMNNCRSFESSEENYSSVSVRFKI